MSTEDQAKKAHAKKIHEALPGIVKFKSLRQALDDVSKTLEKQHYGTVEKMKRERSN